MDPFYFITDPCLLPKAGYLFESVTQAIEGGARLIQYRDKISTRKVMYEQAKALREMTSKRGITLMINDQVDLALAVGADGVHLGQEDLPLWAARKVLGKKALIGISTHTLEEAVQAELDGANYIGFGPVFSTKTKENTRPSTGVAAIAEVAGRVHIPIYAIGGITLDALPAIFEAGARGIVAISAISGDVQSNVRRWVETIRRLRS